MVLILVSGAINAQIRIDSSFAFSTNPAKKYSIYVPSAYNPSVPNEVILAFHPLDLLRWDASSWCDTLLAFAESNDLLLVCPDGGANGDVTDQIDYDFTEALLDSLKKWYHVDTSRMYAFGFSKGGKAVYEFGLSHADLFGGIMSLGVETPTVTGIIKNAGRRPYYLLNGSNDSPSTKLTPLKTSLEANCAYVETNILSGIGHTIDFPNRNQLLKDAYNWIDSVNLSPKTGSITLVDPISFTSVDIKGFHQYPHRFTWERSSLADNCGVMKYEVMFDVPNGDFSNPLVVVSSDSGGIDTVLTASNHVIDSTLAGLGVALNASITLDWTVRSTLLGKYSDTAKAFTIALTRKALGFKLLSPSTNTKVLLENGSNRLFDWQDMLHYISVKYQLLLDDTSGDFSNPVLDIFSPNNGANSNYNISHEALYYRLFFRDHLEIGDSMILKWTARAKDTVYSELAASERIVWLKRGQVGFSLISPPTNAIMQCKKGVNYTFVWDSVPLQGITYEWLFDTLGANLKDTAAIVVKSSGSGTRARISITYEFLDNLMDVYHVDYLDTLHVQWTSRAMDTAGVEYSLETYTGQIIRAHPVGIDSHESAYTFRIFPNPAKDEMHLAWPGELEPVQLKMIDATGKCSLTKRIGKNKTEITLDVSELTPGVYILYLETDKDVLKSNVLIH